MTFLPIVERELRVAARRKSTRRIRLGITVAAIVVVAVFLLFSPMFKAGQAGSLLFKIVTGYVFGLSALAGVFVTSDCLSEEKRAGTLGLLFLTDLEGAGVVVGKFIARSLNPMLAWLAILPVTSFTVLMGGVTGAEFWRMALALLNTLLLSLAVGICVSAWSRDAQRALSVTLGLLVALVILWPMAMRGAGSFQWLNRFSPLVGYSSVFDTSFATRPGLYWSSMLAMQALALFSLLAAAMKIHRAWQDDPTESTVRVVQAARQRTRPRRAEGNPVYWLMQAGSGLRLAIWMVAVAWAAVALGWPLWTGKPMDWPTVLLGSKAVGFVIKVIFVAQVCRFVVEARRGGAMEALLCTPVSEREILQAHWQHLRQLFLGPVVVFLLPLATAMLLGRSLSPGGTGLLSGIVSSFGFSSGGFFILGTVTDFLALACVGLWFALSLRKPALAPGLTILCVLIPPLLLFFIPDIFYDILMLAWARERLERGFRARLSEQYARIEN